MEIRTSIRLQEEDMEAIKASAKEDRRPWTTQMVHLALEAIRKRGESK